ncbi:ABC transporter substrate-binding protein [Anoxybacterium hadale]|uniref:ABC transporter substrate-binding protein n=1 Tax=Anoxybacterium hadale TaxID=3408580 RepID=A0ACD1A7E3_9FIRM|nr:ABC transporter substrate-binding protein [Clostridiales bacterium]
MKKKRTLAALLSLFLFASVILSGCGSAGSDAGADSNAGETGTLDKMTLQLKWLPQSQFMGYYVAAAKGYYEEEGIDIEILPGGSDIIAEQQVYNGVADVGVTWVSSLLKYQSEGWDLLEVSQVFQKSAMLLVSKASTGINSPADLAGKKVGSWFGGNEYEIYALLEANKLNRDKDLELVQQDFTMNQLLNDEIDAASAMTYNEYGLVLEAGYKESDLNVLDMNEEGVAMLEDCLFVSKDWIADNEDLFVRFLRASIKGWADACADPEAAGKIVYEKDQSISLEHQIYMAKEVAKLVAPEGFDPAKIGYIDKDAIQQTADLALKYGLLTSAADLSEDTITSKYWEEATASK